MIRSRYLPRCVVAARDEVRANRRKRGSAPQDDEQSQVLDSLFAGKSSSEGTPVLYICQDFACQAPGEGLQAIEGQLATLSESTRRRP
jgi:hypothetical protein